MVLLVTNLDMLLSSIKLLNIVENHLIIYAGPKRPPNTYLTEEGRPIVILKNGMPSVSQVNIGEV